MNTQIKHNARNAKITRAAVRQSHETRAHRPKETREDKAAVAVLRQKLVAEARAVLREFEDEAEDVVGDLFLAVLERRLGPLTAGAPTAWMSTVVQAFALCRKRELEEYRDSGEL